jgi:tRNA G18 (ribose-2'-O)-methylase SpoU
MAVPRTDHYREALAAGDTLGPRRRPCTHWVQGDRERWVREQQGAGWRVVAVELAEDAVPLPLLEPARGPSLVLLGHEHAGVPDELVERADTCVQIPMVGVGASLNVAVAASLVLYRLAGMA